jgi:hypothetical protein
MQKTFYHLSLTKEMENTQYIRNKFSWTHIFIPNTYSLAWGRYNYTVHYSKNN